MPKRTYTPAERTTALDALARNGGAVRLTARQVGVPYSTLWERASEREHPGGEAHDPGPSSPSLPAALRIAPRFSPLVPASFGHPSGHFRPLTLTPSGRRPATSGQLRITDPANEQ